MRGEQQVPWASRTDSLQRRTSQQQTPRDSPTTGREWEAPFFSPSEQRYEESPNPISPEMPLKASLPPPPSRHIAEQPERRFASAPTEMFYPHSKLTGAPQTLPKQSFDIHSLRHVAPLIAGRKPASQAVGIELDPTAPQRAMRDPRTALENVRKAEEGSLHPVVEEDERARAEEDREKGKAVDRTGKLATTPAAAGPTAGQTQEDGPVWGESFKVEWIRTERLPFTRTRHLRNPWNHDREVKVSRDGTELEATVGQALLEEWDKDEEAQPPASGAPNVDVGRRLPGRASVSANVLATTESPSSAPSGRGRTG